MMGIDEARQHDMAAGVEDCVNSRSRLPAAFDGFNDAAAVDNQTAAGSFSEAGKRVADPLPHLCCLLP
jgi:hypothetical protein